MWVIDEILMLLKDGNWHDLKEITEKLSLDELKVELITNFISKYNFAELNKNGQKVKLRPLMLKFINEIQHIREYEAVRT